MKRSPVIILILMLLLSGCGKAPAAEYSSEGLSFTAAPGTVITEEEEAVSASKGDLSVRITVTDALQYASGDAADWDRTRLDLRSGAYRETFANSWFIYEFFKYLTPDGAFCAPPSETRAGKDGLMAFTSSFSGDDFSGELTETVKNGQLITVYVLVKGTDISPFREDIDTIIGTIDVK